MERYSHAEVSARSAEVRGDIQPSMPNEKSLQYSGNISLGVLHRVHAERL